MVRFLGNTAAERVATAMDAIRTPQAPALLLPDLIDRGTCRDLIEFWHAHPKFAGPVSTGAEGVLL